MRMFLISDNVDTKAGMRLAGVDGVVVHKREEIVNEINNVLRTPDIGIILITEINALIIPDIIMEIKLSRKDVLIVEIPDRHGTRREKNSITKYVQEAIGLKI
jgi:V/A-type H+-transporting ATPase subunit F